MAIEVSDFQQQNLRLEILQIMHNKTGENPHLTLRNTLIRAEAFLRWVQHGAIPKDAREIAPESGTQEVSPIRP